MQTRHVWKWIYLPVILAPLLAGVLAQTVRGFEAAGRIVGVLSDPSGAVVPGGRVTITNLESNLTRTAMSDRLGSYAVDGLPGGRYRLTATAAGFEASTREDVVVPAGQDTTVGFALAIVQSKTVVDVSEQAAAVGEDAIVFARSRTSDAAVLLKDVPGMSLAGGGGVSSLPVMHGMADDRINVLIDGMTIVSACANHMNPPNVLLEPGHCGLSQVMAGITPVSQGGDSIGGTIAIESAAPQFAGPGQGVVTHGGISAFHRTNGVVNGGNAWLSTATENFRIGYVGSYVTANNYKNGAGAMVKSTFYETQNNALQLAARRGSHLVTVDLGYQHIPQQGFANARMDMTLQ